MRKSYDEEHTTMYVMESWQIYQRLGLNLSKNKEEDLKRLKYIVNRNIELHPENSDAYNARALIGLSYFGFSCEQAIADIDRAEKNGSNQETLLIGSGVYSRCGQVEEAISRLQELLRIVPNDPGWFQTGMLVTMLYWDGQHYEKNDLIGQKIAASQIASCRSRCPTAQRSPNGDYLVQTASSCIGVSVISCGRSLTSFLITAASTSFASPLSNSGVSLCV